MTKPPAYVAPALWPRKSRNEARIMGDEGGTITLTAQLNRPQAGGMGLRAAEFGTIKIVKQ